MNNVIRQEVAHNYKGIEGRLFNVIQDDITGIIRNQRFSASKVIKYDGMECKIYVNVRFDDECNNRHETFAITGDIYKASGKSDRNYISGGCIHDELEKYFPELKHLIKWHLVSTDEPMHYIANTIYHASDKDCWGLRKGKERDLEAARRSAVWPDATDEELLSDDLKEKLIARRAPLLEAFKADMLEFGFIYPSAEGRPAK